MSNGATAERANMPHLADINDPGATVVIQHVVLAEIAVYQTTLPVHELQVGDKQVEARLQATRGQVYILRACSRGRYTHEWQDKRRWG